MPPPLSVAARGLAARWLAPLWLCAMACLWSCSGGVVASEPAAAGPFRPAVHIPLEPIGEAPPTALMIRRVVPPQGIAPWVPMGTQAMLKPLPGTGPDTAAIGNGKVTGLRLGGAQRKLLRIPGVYRPNEFNRVVVDLVSRIPVEGRLRFFDGKQRRAELDARLPAGSLEVRQLMFDMRGNPIMSHVCNEMRVELTSGEPLFVAAVSFWRVRIDDWAPDPAAGPTGILVGRDWRLGFTVSSTRPLEATVQVPRGGVLDFSYARIPGLLRPKDLPELQLRVESGSKTRTVKTLGFTRTESADAWNSVAVPLEEHEGRIARVHMSVEPAGKRSQFLAISDPVVYTRREAPPTVTLITSDSHRADYVGAYNGRDVKTVALDKLAETGVLFEDCFAAANTMRPSHTALMTGISPRDTGVVGDGGEIDEGVLTIAEQFRSAGWATVAVVSTSRIGPERSDLSRGFDRVMAPTRGESSARSAVKWLRSQLQDLGDRPVLVWVHFYDAHLPYTPPGGLARHYLGAGFDTRDERLPVPREPLPEILPGEDGDFVDFFLECLYRAEISFVDQQVGVLLGVDRLRRGPIVFTADHGETLGERGTVWNQGGLYPQTLHVPLIINWPGAPAGTRISAPVSQLDLGRTLLDLAGLEDTDFPGTNLIRHVHVSTPRPTASSGGRQRRKADVAPPPATPRFAVSGERRSVSITAGGWHLTLALTAQQDDASAPEHTVELYDLADDPLCATDLQETERERARAMRNRLVKWITAEGSAGRDWIDPDCECDHCAGFRP